MGHAGDVSHATPALARFGERHWAAKSAHDVEQFLEFFSRTSLTYADATLGSVRPDFASFRDTIAAMMPHWGTGVSYGLRMLGDERSAVVAIRDSPELFGAEIMALCAADFDDDGRVVRWVDYWDSRAFGAERAAALRTAPAAFPDTFGEDRVPGRATPEIVAVVGALSGALARGDADAAAALLTPSATFEDMTLRTRLRGAAAVARYLGRAADLLPYGPGSGVRRILGNELGGGYEWTNPGHPARRGITAVELDGNGRISDVVAVWDGALADPAALARATTAALE